MNKDELISYIHTLHHNWSVADERLYNVIEVNKKRDKACKFICKEDCSERAEKYKPNYYKEELDCFRQLIEEHFLNKSSIKQFRIHIIKIEPQYFKKAAADLKPWEIRVNDRDYKSGDILVLKEWDPDKKEFTGKILIRRITEVFKDLPYLPNDVVIMTIK